MKNIVWLILVVFGTLSSCSKMEDAHKPYLNDGDLRYVGAPYDVVVLSKTNCVEIQFKKTTDPSILKYIIYWNNRANSLEVIPSENIVESVTIPSLVPGSYSFELIAVDKAGNKSKIVYAAGTVN